MSKHSKKINKLSVFVWLIVVFLSAVFIVVSNRYVSKDLSIFNGTESTFIARVTGLDECIETSASGYSSKIQVFFAEILNGEFKGKEVVATQELNDFSMYKYDPVSKGSIIVLYKADPNQSISEWVFGNYFRLSYIAFLALLFFALVLYFGKIKGVNTLISLLFTILAVFIVFIPAVLNGFNIYFATFIICLYVIIMTLLVTNGLSIKSITTICGCSFGVALAAVLNVIFSKIMHLTGIVDEHSVYLQFLNNGKSIDLIGLIFAMTTIGAMGAVMDVAMDISSSLSEIHFRNTDLPFNEIFKSGLRIGRDIMGTMANTLVLAYIGSSLCSTLLYITYASSLMELLNKEGIIVELMQSIIGSLAILLTIPLTSFICSVFFSNKNLTGK